ncbi:hypothetical protein M409DRAFT_48763 [Zasmidium cellare ATCC 36951]|uniref:Transcription factor domain-containing protein n=1 Tax=Zasmidium cellare ATCC 36951 TaxID=1080233 RepID=A0A6A6D468_ZASCE|nr:uncharacterized protein M409DRAFT_48763 [Zasmidium cellare ATCC 36951]KAF2173845.1 hypothetical protein M409DRAFT_48763 [Zasmidium cellare ATCC 36951]
MRHPPAQRCHPNDLTGNPAWGASSASSEGSGAVVGHRNARTAASTGWSANINSGRFLLDRLKSSNGLESSSRRFAVANDDCFRDADGEGEYLLRLSPGCPPSASLDSLAEGWIPTHAAALHYFRTFAAADFKGYLASEFWTSMLYQKSEYCVPVRQALLAISNAHRERVTTSAETLSGSTLRLYVTAIQLAVEHMEQESTISEKRATSLYCCAVFYCFELFNKNPQAADIHLDNGLRLLREWHRLSPTWPPSGLRNPARDDFTKLLYTLGRLDLDRMLRDAVTRSSEHDDKIFASGLTPLSDRPADDYFALKGRMMLLSRRITRFVRRYDHPDTMPIAEVPAHVLFSRLQLQSQITEMEILLDERERGGSAKRIRPDDVNSPLCRPSGSTS